MASAAHPERHEPHRPPHRPHRHAPRRARGARGRLHLPPARGAAAPRTPDPAPLATREAAAAPAQALAPWHFLNFLPDPHQHGSLRPTFWCSLLTTVPCCWGARVGGGARAVAVPA